MSELTFSEPLCILDVANWPAAGQRVTAKFRVVQRGGVQWGYRVTTGKQRQTPRASTVRILTGSDGQHYFAGRQNKTDRVFLMAGTMRDLQWPKPGTDLYYSIHDVLEGC